MKNLFLLGLMLGLALWIVILRRQLVAATSRGDMYREISARLDRKVAALTAREG